MRTTATVLALQAGLTLVLALVVGWFDGEPNGYAFGSEPGAGEKLAVSVLIGGGINMITSLVYGLRIFAGGGDAQDVLRRFYRGEFQKLLLTGVLFFAVIKWMDVDFLGVMLGFIASLISFWIALLMSGLGNPDQQTLEAIRESRELAEGDARDGEDDNDEDRSWY